MQVHTGEKCLSELQGVEGEGRKDYTRLSCGYDSVQDWVKVLTSPCKKSSEAFQSLARQLADLRAEIPGLVRAELEKALLDREPKRARRHV